MKYFELSVIVTYGTFYIIYKYINFVYNFLKISCTNSLSNLKLGEGVYKNNIYYKPGRSRTVQQKKIILKMYLIHALRMLIPLFLPPKSWILVKTSIYITDNGRLFCLLYVKLTKQSQMSIDKHTQIQTFILSFILLPFFFFSRTHFFSSKLRPTP